MLFRDGIKPGEVAAELGLSVHTVIAHKRTAILKLREKLLGYGLKLAVFFFFLY
jgi:DNA-directed RNA polymerase specialized sigma24 family protein